MSLREELRELLPAILPSDPNEAIKGTELIRLTKFRLRQDYSDATLRYHFSVMSCDPSAPIAKVAQGQGYYRRPDTNEAGGGARHLIAFRQPMLAEQLGKSPSEIDRDLLHAEKFRAVVARHLLAGQRFPFLFEQAFHGGRGRENLWRFPDAVAVDWPAAETTDSGLRLDPRIVERRRARQAPLFVITALKLRLAVSHDSAREEFFQCLSHSEWAHASDFLIATPVDDASLADLLASLGQRHGVGVMSMGFSPEVLDELPEASSIGDMNPAEVEAMLSRGVFRRLSLPRVRPQPAWELLDSREYQNPEMDALFAWIDHCLEGGLLEPVGGESG